MQARSPEWGWVNVGKEEDGGRGVLLQRRPRSHRGDDNVPTVLVVVMVSWKPTCV